MIQGVSFSSLLSRVRRALFKSFCRADRVSQSPSAAILACSGQVEGSVRRNKFGFSSSRTSLILSMSVDASRENDVIPANLSSFFLCAFSPKTRAIVLLNTYISYRLTNRFVIKNNPYVRPNQ